MTPAEDGGIDPRLDLGILADRLAKGGLEGGGLGVGERHGRDHLGRDEAPTGRGQALEGGDDFGQRIRAAIGRQKAKELRGEGLDAGALGDGGEALALVLGGEPRRGQKPTQIRALAQQLGEALQVGLDGFERPAFDGKVEQRLRVSRAHIRRPGVVSHVKFRPVSFATPDPGNPDRREGLDRARRIGAFGASRRSPRRRPRA